MCGRSWRDLECLGGRAEAGYWYWLGPGNTNAALSGWVGTGRVGYRVLPLPTQPQYRTPYPYPPPPTSTSQLAATASFGSTKEILGVNNALLDTVPGTPHLTQAPRSP